MGQVLLPASVVETVLDQYPAVVARTTLLPLGNRGGFSGARLWRVETLAGSFCLKAWPAGSMAEDRLGLVHRWMSQAREHGLTYVPLVFPTRAGPTWVRQAGWVWELLQWLPGTADFQEPPAPARVAAACQALARLHEVLARQSLARRSCPAVARRLSCLREWLALLDSGWRPDLATQPLLPATLSRRALELLHKQARHIPEQLGPWTDRVLALQPCLCDVWRAHVLFQEEEVVGLIDYGSMKVDHVAVDLARLLGSFAGNSQEAWRTGLAAYRQLRPLSAQEEELIAVLDRTGTILALANWLRWLFHDRKPFEDMNQVVQRLGTLVQRLETGREQTIAARQR